MFGGNKIS